MFYHLLYELSDALSALNVVRYITFRAFVALFTALFVYLLFGQRWIDFLARKQFSQTIRTEGPETHQQKRGTPTMGGVLIGLSVLLSTLLWMDFSNPFVWAGLIVFVTFGAVGFWDDYKKVILKDAKGFPGRYKIIIETFVCLVVCLWIYGYHGVETVLTFPLFKDLSLDLSFGYMFFGALVIVGAANAVNLTDGLDGLVAVPAMVSFITYSLFAYIAGHAMISAYLQFPFVSGAGEVTVLCAAVVGALMGFLWFNSYPAQIFMGDVGALALGGLLGFVALVAKQEILLVVVGGVFVVETLSVILQVMSFKLTGKRLFRMAPLHHHFELKGWAEPKVIVRFWIVSFILALMSMATLKLR